jgi:uncharacterized membrane protein YfcA
MFSPVEIIAILLIGVASGVVTGIMGGSGVVIVVPALALFLAFPIHTAIGTSLFINVVAAAVTSAVFYRHRNIYLKPGLWIALGSVAGAQAGSAIADLIPPLGLSYLFGIFMIPLGIRLWRRGVRREASLGQDSPATAILPSAESWRNRSFALGLGLVVGMLCGLFGFGGGLMFLLILIFVLRYPLHLAVGTSAFIMAITASSGALGYGLRGNIEIYAALIASVPTVLAAGLGARVANRVTPATLGKIIGGIFILLGIAMIVTRFIA